VEAATTSLPELDADGGEAEAAPVGRARDVLPLKASLGLGEARFEHRAGSDDLALRGGPGTDLAEARALAEIVLALLAGYRGDPAKDSDLALDGCPEEDQGSVGAGGQLGALAAAVVGEEDKSTVVDALEQHHARGRVPVGVGGGEGHGVGLVHLGAARLVEPAGELLERIGVNLALVEGGQGIVAAQGGQVVHGLRSLVPMRDATTLDAIFSGALPLRQPARGHGYRFNVDALLLAREALGIGPTERAADLGAGCGVAGLALWLLGGCRALTLVERDFWVASLAARNAAFFPGVSVLAAPVEDLPPLALFDRILSNPPYTPPDDGRPCPERRRAAARHGDLGPFLDAVARLLAPKGEALLVYPCQALPSLLADAARRLLWPQRLRFVHPHPAAPARVALVGLARSLEGALLVEPPWFERDGLGHPDPSLASFLAGPWSTTDAMTSAPSPTADPVLDDLARLTDGLLLPSERDAPLTPTLLAQAPSPEVLRSASGAPQDAPVEEGPLEALFTDLEREHPSQDDHEQAEARRFQALHGFFRERLREGKVFRVGQTEIEVWVLGQDEQGRWVGLRSQVVET
jgi:tRNA1Val (adenine37-N6)-methyltransferase